MKIFIQGMNFAPEPIGVGRFTGELAAYLASEGHDVTVVTTVPHYPGWKLRNGYTSGRFYRETLHRTCVIRCPLILHKGGRGIWRLLAPLSYSIAAAPSTFWQILAQRPQTVLCIEPTLLAAPVALLAARIIRCPCFLHIQDLEVDAAFEVGHLRHSWVRRLALACERWILRKMDTIITISTRMKERLIRKGIPSSSIKVLRNWVDIKRVTPMKAPSHVREMFNISPEAFVVLYSGHVGPKQGLNILLEAAKELIEIAPEIVVVVAGEGPSKQDLLNKYSGLPNVRLLPLQPEEQLCEFLSMADLHALIQTRSAADLVLPSKLGAMLASGKRIIATADSDTEIANLLEGVASIVPPGDVGALAHAIKAASETQDVSASRRLELSLLFSAETILPAFARVLTHTGSAGRVITADNLVL